MNSNKIPVIGALIERLRHRSDHEMVKAAMATKGDIAKMEGYDNLSKCIARLSTIDGGNSGAMGRPLRAVKNAHATLIKSRPIFQKAFRDGGSEATRLVYASAVTALWHTVSMLCAQGVNFTKGNDGLYRPTVNAQVNSLSSSIPVTRLEKFVESAGKYGFEAVITEHAETIEREVIGESIAMTVAVAAAAVTGLITLLYIARDLAEYYFQMRGTTARWLETQAKFLEMNAAALEGGQAGARAKQEAYAARFRSVAERLKIDAADAERGAERGIRDDDANLSRVQAQPDMVGGGQLL